MRPTGTTHVEGGADQAVCVPHQNSGFDTLVAENIVLWVVSALHNSVFTLSLGRRGSGMPRPFAGVTWVDHDPDVLPRYPVDAQEARNLGSRGEIGMEAAAEVSDRWEY